MRIFSWLKRLPWQLDDVLTSELPIALAAE